MVTTMRDSRKRVLIIGADGLRPDLVHPDSMPTYVDLMQRGTLFESFYSAFPTHTRVNMTTLTTGTKPGRHGVINNVMFVSGLGEAGLIDTSDPVQLADFERRTGEPVVRVPTLGDRLRFEGDRLAVAASSTPGASLLWNVRHPQRILNPASTYGDADLMALHDKLGKPAEESGRSKYESTRWATRALIDVLLDDPSNRAITLWLTEPDASQHFYGLGSPEAREGLRVVDACVAEVLAALEAKGLSDRFEILLVSDHGHSSVAHARSLSEHLTDAREALSLAGDLRAVGDFIYSPSGSYQAGELRALVTWLQSQPWCGLLFSTVGELSGASGVLPLEIATGPLEHDRGPLLAVCPTWHGGTNEFGVAGVVDTLTSYAPLKATHGTASPFDMRAFCLGVGPSFAAGVVVDAPCGTVDIAPTVWELLGYEDTDFDGSSLLRLAGTPWTSQVIWPGGGSDGVEVATIGRRSYFLGSVGKHT